MSLAFDANVDLALEAKFGASPLDSGLTYPDDLSAYFRGAKWTRGRSRTQSPFAAGRGFLFLDNSNGDFYSFDTAAAFYPDIEVGVPFRLVATYNSTDYGQVYGYVESWESAFPTNREEIVAVPFVETYGRLVRDSQSFTIAAQSTDARVGALLDAGGWDATRRNLDTGLASVAALDDEESTVAFRLEETAIVEQGSLFQDREGDIRFRNRVAYSGVTPTTVFGPSGADLTYTDISYEDSEDLLYNEARVSDVNSDVVTVINAASVAVHGTITHPQIDSIEIPNQAAALSVAEWIVLRHQGLDKRVDGLRIDPAGGPSNLWPVALGLDLRDVITVKAKYPGATDTFQQNLTVEKISVDIRPEGVWTVSYNLNPLSDFESQTFFQLDVSQLDGTHPLA